MNQRYENPKETSRAMNGKMFLMMIGAVLVFSAVSSTIMYGINMFVIAGEAAKGTEDYVNALAEVGMSITAARMSAAVFFVSGLAELAIGLGCMMLQNRLDKIFLTRKLVLALLAVELLANAFLFTQGLGSIGRLFSSLLIPAFLLWVVFSLCKLARKYPDRKFIIDQKKKEAPKPAAKKSLRERAMVPPAETEAAPEREPEEAYTEPEREPEEAYTELKREQEDMCAEPCAAEVKEDQEKEDKTNV